MSTHIYTVYLYISFVELRVSEFQEWSRQETGLCAKGGPGGHIQCAGL